ncbi:hypothetical protein [Flavobacterium ardleyense]|uniref:hypothetical protein n=1 Tax=Flavobacterium ardleyense TaxID=2038737 RepID=UPI00298BF0C3|nr:hypothetical protein [Flavobacterium ardleyense]
MKKLAFIILLLFIIISCADKKKFETEKIIFISSPSFYNSFKIELDNKSKKIIASIPYEYSLADSISKNTWKFIDSTDLESIRKFLPKEIKFEVKPEYSKFQELESILVRLSKLRTSEFPPEDGINIYLETENSQKIKSKKVFYSPNEKSEEGKLIIKTYEIIAKIFKDETKLEDAIENSQRYFNDEIYIVKSTKPLYVKFLDSHCDNIENEIGKLPYSKTIFVDLTNYRKDKNECLEKTLRKKYSKIKWILKTTENYGFAEE